LNIVKAVIGATAAAAAAAGTQLRQSHTVATAAATATATAASTSGGPVCISVSSGTPYYGAAQLQQQQQQQQQLQNQALQNKALQSRGESPVVTASAWHSTAVGSTSNSSGGVWAHAHARSKGELDDAPHTVLQRLLRSHNSV
jgi:transcription initiation factor TFIID subunit TAF12